MLRILKYRFKIIVSNKVNVFWALFFPIALVSLFNLAFSNIDEENIYKENRVGIVTTNKDSQLVKMMKDIKDDDLNLFTLEYLSKDEGLKKLSDEKLSAVVEINEKDDFKLTLKKHDFNQVMIESFLNRYKQDYTMIQNTIEKDPSIVMKGWLDNIVHDKDYVRDGNVSSKVNDGILTSFYSAIAMACMFGSFIAASAPNTLQPNISYQGARVYVSPIKKWYLVFADLLSSFVIILVSLIILMLYMANVLKIDFGNQWWPIMLIVTIGSLLATTLGYFISLSLKRKETIKTIFILIVTMLGSFLAGMMGQIVKYNVEQIVPFIKYINPVALITDSFNILYYYDDFSLVTINLLCLLVMFILFFIGSIIILRRDRYDSL